MLLIIKNTNKKNKYKYKIKLKYRKILILCYKKNNNFSKFKINLFRIHNITYRLKIFYNSNII